MNGDEQMLRQVQQVLGARGEAAVGTVVDGLGSLLVKARGGDRSSRAALRTLRDLLRQIDDLVAIALPGEN